MLNLDLLNAIAHGIFYFFAVVGIGVCILTANNMTENTCVCMRGCLKLIIFGLLAQVAAVWYELHAAVQAVAATPIVIGISGWLIFDKYRAHEELDLLAFMLRMSWRHFRDRLSRIFRKLKKASNQ
jgi:hypothetical protein